MEETVRRSNTGLVRTQKDRRQKDRMEKGAVLEEEKCPRNVNHCRKM